MTESRKDEGRRQTISVVIAAVLGVVVVVGVLLVTLSAGRSDDPDGAAIDGASTTIASVSPELREPIVVPEGDYTALCAELAKQASGLTGEITPEQVKAVYQQLDFEPLIAAAPEGLVPSLEQVRDERDAVLLVIDQVDDTDQLQSADLPEGFMRSFLTVSTATTERCAPGG